MEDSVSILKLNLVIITGYVALLGFIYEDIVTFDELGVALFLFLGLFGWLLSSSMCVYAYWGSRRQTERQVNYYFNESKPESAKVSLSEFLIKHKSRQRILINYPPLALFLSFASIPFLVLSLVVEEIAVRSFLIVIMAPALAIMLGLVIGTITVFWNERRTIKHEIQKEGSKTLKRNIVPLLANIPIIFNKKELKRHQEIFIVSKDETGYRSQLRNNARIYIYSITPSEDKEFCGKIEGLSDEADDDIYLMNNEDRIDIFMLFGDEIVEFRNCEFHWRNFGELIWECEYSVNSELLITC